MSVHQDGSARELAVREVRSDAALPGDPACSKTPSPNQASDDPDAMRVRQLVLAAVLGGLFLDDPWRHSYLRNRWSGR